MILNGDCLELLARQPDNSVDLIVTDPPYEISTSGGGIYADKTHCAELAAIKDGFAPEILNELCRVMKKINIYIFCSQKQIIGLLDYFVTKKKCNWNLLTWHKTNPVPACGNKYLSDTEFILFFREKGVKIGGEYHSKFTYYSSPLNTKDKKLYGHPTIKPIPLITNFITNSSEEGQIVLDPFMGSGTTGVVCAQTNRNFIGMEIEKQWCEIAEARIEQVIASTKEIVVPPKN